MTMFDDEKKSPPDDAEPAAIEDAEKECDDSPPPIDDGVRCRRRRSAPHASDQEIEIVDDDVDRHTPTATTAAEEDPFDRPIPPSAASASPACEAGVPEEIRDEQEEPVPVPDPSFPVTIATEPFEEHGRDGGGGGGGIAVKIRKESAASAALQRSLQATDPDDDCPTHPSNVEGTDFAATTAGPPPKKWCEADFRPDDSAEQPPSAIRSRGGGDASFAPANPPAEGNESGPAGVLRPVRSPDGAVVGRADDSSRDVATALPLDAFLPPEPEPGPKVYEGVLEQPEEESEEIRRRRNNNDGNKRAAFLLALLVSVAAIVASVVGAVLATNDEDADDAGGAAPGPAPPRIETVPSTLSPTFAPPPLDCVVEDLGPVLEDGCGSVCSHNVARDGESVYVLRRDGGNVTIQFLPSSKDDNTDESAPPASYAFEYSTDGGMAFSEDSLFLRNAHLNAVYVVPKGSSSGILVPNETATIVPAPESIDWNAKFGGSISTHGDLLVIGAHNDGGKSRGSAFVYRRANATTTTMTTAAATWTQEAKLVPDDPLAQGFGVAVLLATEDRILVGCDFYGDDDRGAVFVYERTTTTGEDSPSDEGEGPRWRPSSHLLLEDDCDGRFGSSLALVRDGWGLLVGCPKESADRGAVYYYELDGGNYAFEQKLMARDGKISDKLGLGQYRLAVNSEGDVAVVGTNSDSPSSNPNAAYVFTLSDDGVWSEVAAIESPEYAPRFASDLVISGNRVLIASWRNVFSYVLNCTDRAWI